MGNNKKVQINHTTLAFSISTEEKRKLDEVKKHLEDTLFMSLTYKQVIQHMTTTFIKSHK